MRAARRETLQKDVKIAREKARAALTRPALFAILFKLYRRGSILRAALRGELSEWSMVQHSKSTRFHLRPTPANPHEIRLCGTSQRRGFSQTLTVCSQFSFLAFLRLGGQTYMERYRSGHNGPDSKCSFSGLHDHVIFIARALQFLLFSV